MTAITRPAPRWQIQAVPIRGARLWWLAFGGLLAARVVLSAVSISRPGLNFDETLFVNAATLRIPGLWIFHSIGGIPVMVYPYIGALKSWLYDPIFAVFGTSPATIRLPVVLIASAGLVLVYLAVRDLVNRPVAMLAFAALCFDQSLFWLTRDDIGPSAIMLFLKCAALWCAAGFARHGTRRWVWMLLAALAVGVFYELSFIWVVNAAAACSVVLMIRHRNALRAHVKTVATWFGGLAVIYAAFAAYYLGDHPDRIYHYRGGAVGQSFVAFEHGFREAVSGTGFYDWVLGPLQPRDVVVVLVLALFVVGSLAGVAGRRSRNIAIGLLALTTLLMAFQVLLTPEAIKPSHYIAIYPFVTIVAAYGVYAIASSLLRRSPAVYAAMACALALMLAYDGALLGKYLNGISSKDPKPYEWSPAIYRLSDVLERMPGRVYTADWGIMNPLFALHPSRRFVDLSFSLFESSRASATALGRRLERVPGPKLFVTHPTSGLAFPGVNANLFAALGRHLHLTLTVTGYHHQRVYLVYRYR